MKAIMRIVSSSVSATLLLAASLAAAEDEPPPLSDLHGREAVVEDLTPRRPGPLVPLESDGVELGVSVATRRGERRRDYSGSVVLTLPTDFGLAAAKAKASTEPPDAADETTVMERAPRSDEPPTLLLLIRPRDARSAIAAASRHARHDSVGSRLDGLSSRARWSALLPKLRLRATRLIDESSSLSPTQYDPNRTTSKGGASLWLEARSTWRLDRLVFANEEIGVERMRRRLDEERADTAQRTLDLLFDWQRALHRMYDPMLHPDRCIQTLLEEQQLRVRVDVVTGGWLSRWLRERTIDALDCSQQM